MSFQIAAPRRQSSEEIADSEAIERFVKLHTQVMSLAKTYSQLIAGGCTFFEMLGCGIHCDKPDDVIVSIASSKSSSAFDYRRQDSFKTQDLNLAKIQEFFDKALTDWTQQVTFLRDEFRSFNFFDLNQIKYLIPIISNVINSSVDTECADLQMIRNMLFNVHPCIDVKVLKSAYKMLSFKKSASKSMQTDKIDLKNAWLAFLQDQNECVENQLGMKSFAMLLREIEKIALNQRLLTPKNRQIPGYLINISRF